jgi:hypothetical protein
MAMCAVFVGQLRVRCAIHACDSIRLPVTTLRVILRTIGRVIRFKIHADDVIIRRSTVDAGWGFFKGCHAATGFVLAAARPALHRRTPFPVVFLISY